MQAQLRTSLILPVNLHQRLTIAARRQKKPIARVVREILNTGLMAEENSKVKQIYQAVDKLENKGSKGVKDASSNINETLYGKQGAWQPAE